MTKPWTVSTDSQQCEGDYHYALCAHRHRDISTPADPKPPIRPEWKFLFFVTLYLLVVLITVTLIGYE